MNVTRPFPAEERIQNRKYREQHSKQTHDLHTKHTNMCDSHGFWDTLIPQSAAYCTIQQ